MLLSIYKIKPQIINLGWQAFYSVYGLLYIASFLSKFLKDRNGKFKTGSLLFMQTCLTQQSALQAPMMLIYYLHMHKTNKLQPMTMSSGLDMMLILTQFKTAIL